MADIHSELMGLLARVPYVRCEDVHRQYAVNWLMNNGVTIPVRCKDCKHFDEHTKKCYVFSHDCIEVQLEVDGDHFCSCGERKDNG